MPGCRKQQDAAQVGDSGEEDGSVALITVQRCAKKAITRRRRRWRSPDGPLPLLVFAEGIPLFSGGETALRAEADLLERHVLRWPRRDALYPPADSPSLTVFGGDQPEDHLLVAGRIKAQRREIPGAVVVVLRKKASTLTPPNSTSATGLVTAFRDPG